MTPTGDRRRWLALIVVLMATFMDMIDVTIINVALPRIQRDLDTGYSTGQWLLAGYALAFALLLVTGGRLGDIFGRRKLFMIGVAGFAVASAAAGAAWSPAVLVAARIAQGAFGGIMVPQVMSVITSQFAPGKERVTAFGVFGGVIGLAQVSGPLLGGVLTDYSVFGLGWRAIFLINLPICLFALVGAVLWMRESKSEHPLKLDVPGVFLVGGASLLVLYPLMQGRDLGWPAWTFAALAASVPTLIAFGRYERRRENRGESPLVPTHLFGQRSFTVGVIVMIVLFSGIASYFLVLTWHLQIGLGWSPMHLALTTLGWPLGISFTGQIANRYGHDHGRKLVGIGALVLAAGTGALIWVIDHFGTEVSSWHVLPCMFVSGLGLGLCVGIIVNVVLGDVPQADSGAASGVLNSTIQIGNAIGVALVGVIFFGLLDARQANFAETASKTLYYNLAVFLLAALLSPLLPRRAAALDEEPAPV